MWAGYGIHTVAMVWTVSRRAVPLPVPASAARVVGGVMTGAGLGLCVAGMGRFAGPRELTGTHNQALTTSGVYEYTRNPQYLGYLLALTGAALARRSGAALGTTGALAVVYADWIPVEEEHLTALHGHDYTDYTRRTSRWWGRHKSTDTKMTAGG